MPRKKSAKRPTGRPSEYCPKLAHEICEKIFEGKSLLQVLKSKKYPARATIYRWLADKNNRDFRDSYALAREGLADYYFERITEIAFSAAPKMKTKFGTAVDPAAVRKQDQQISALMHVAGRMAPHKHGPKAEAERAGDQHGLPTPVYEAQEQLTKPLDI